MFKLPRTGLRATVETFVLSLSVLYFLFAFRGVMQLYFGSNYNTIHVFVILTVYFSSFFYLIISPFSAKFSGYVVLGLFVFYNFITFGWSSSRDATFQAVFGMIGIVTFGAAILKFWGYSFARNIAILIVIYVSASVFMFFLGLDVTNYNYMQESAFQGLAGHKNIIGNMSGLAAAILYSSWRVSRIRLDFAFLLIVVFSIFISKSSTSLLALIFSIALTEFSIFGSRRLVPFSFFALISLYFLILVSLGVFYGWQNLLVMLGENETLSSRTKIWEIVLSVAGANFWFGQGYGAFWADGSFASDRAAAIFFGTSFKQSHNGFIDIYAQSGFLGFVLAIAVLAFAVMNAYRVGRAIPEVIPLFSALIFLIANNMGEANLFIPNYLSLAIVSAALFLNSPKKEDAPCT